MVVGVVGVGSRDGLLDPEEVVDVAEFGGGLGMGRYDVGVGVVVLRGDNVLEALPGEVVVLGVVEILNAGAPFLFAHIRIIMETRSLVLFHEFTKHLKTTLTEGNAVIDQ